MNFLVVQMLGILFKDYRVKMERLFLGSTFECITHFLRIY